MKVWFAKWGEPVGVDGEIAEVTLKVVGEVAVAMEADGFEEVDEFGAFSRDAREDVALVLAEDDGL